MGVGGQISFFQNSTRFKGMSSRPGYTEKFKPLQTGDLGMGSKGQLPLDFFKSVGICDGAPSNVF